MDEFQLTVIERLTRIETKQDNTHDSLSAMELRLSHLEDNHPHPDHEERIRSLEKKVWLVAGGLAALSWLADRLPTILGG